MDPYCSLIWGHHQHLALVAFQEVHRGSAPHLVSMMTQMKLHRAQPPHTASCKQEPALAPCGNQVLMRGPLRDAPLEIGPGSAQSANVD